jgi:hypothetical protein
MQTKNVVLGVSSSLLISLVLSSAAVQCADLVPCDDSPLHPQSESQYALRIANRELIALEGLDNVAIQVTGLSSGKLAYNDDGPKTSERTVLSMIEKLKAIGVNAEIGGGVKGYPLFAVDIVEIPERLGVVFSATLTDKVQMARQPGRYYFATTWSCVSKKTNMDARYIQAELDRLIDKFVADCRAANPNRHK